MLVHNVEVYIELKIIKMLQKVKFINKDKTQFFKTLKERVDIYFKENNISQHANSTMVFKTIFMLSLYFIPYVLIITGGLSLIGMWICSLIMGLGLAGIGMSVMHDANHGAYSSNVTINKLLSLSLSIVGGDNKNWKTQHNFLHHTYTNIYNHDKDIDNRIIMRFLLLANGREYKNFKFFIFLYSIPLCLYTGQLQKIFFNTFNLLKRAITERVRWLG